MKITNFTQFNLNLLNLKPNFTKLKNNNIQNNNNFNIFNSMQALSNYSKAFLLFTGRKKVDISKEELETYIAEHPDENMEKIAKHFGVATSTIFNLINDYGINYQKKHRENSISKEELEKYIVEHPKENMEEIGKHFEVDQSIISELIKKYGTSYQKKHLESSISKEDLEKYIVEHPKENMGDIGTHFGVSKQTISNLINKYGIIYQDKRQANISKEELEKYIVEHPDENMEKIGKHFEVSTSTIFNLINDYGINYQNKEHQNSISEEELETYINENNGKTQEEIAKHFEVSKSTIFNLINDYGINYQKKR